MEKSSALTEGMVKADTGNPEYPAVPKNPSWRNGAPAMIVNHFDGDRSGYFLDHIFIKPKNNPNVKPPGLLVDQSSFDAPIQVLVGR